MSKPAAKPRGRPPKGDATMMLAITVRFPEPMMREIEAIVQSRPLEQPDKGQVVRELIAEALTARGRSQRRNER